MRACVRDRACGRMSCWYFRVRGRVHACLVIRPSSCHFANVLLRFLDCLRVSQVCLPFARLVYGSVHHFALSLPIWFALVVGLLFAHFLVWPSYSAAPRLSQTFCTSDPAHLRSFALLLLILAVALLCVQYVRAVVSPCSALDHLRVSAHRWPRKSASSTFQARVSRYRRVSL